MEPVPPAPRPADDEVVIWGSTRLSSSALAPRGSALVRHGFRGLRWQRAELTVPAGPIFLGSRTELTFRRRPRRAWSVATGRLEAALVCEERVTIGSGKSQTTRTAIVVRHLIEAPLVTAPSGVEARFTVEVPMVAGGPTLRIGPAASVVWRVEARLDGEGLPGVPSWFPLVVAPVIAPAWFDRRSPL